MNEQLQTKLIEWAEKLGDIASEQLPDFANQIVAYTIWDATIGMYISIAFLAFPLLLTLMCLVMFPFEKGDERCAAVAIGSFSLLACVIPALAIHGNYSKIKKCSVAPKLVVLEKIHGK